LDARLQRQPSVPPKSHRGDPPEGPERKGQPRDDVRRVAHETAAQRQRAARAKDHNIAEETNGDEATMDERDNDKESGDGAGRATRTRGGGTGADSRKRSGSVTTRPEDDERATRSRRRPREERCRTGSNCPRRLPRGAEKNENDWPKWKKVERGA